MALKVNGILVAGLGTNGAGVPSGGEANQILQKNSPVDYDTSWVDMPFIATKTSELENDADFTTTTSVDEKLQAHRNNTELHITAEERELWNGANAYTDTAIANLVNSAPETLDTLGELATAFQENKEVVDVLNEAITTKADKTEVENAISTANTYTEEYVNTHLNDNIGNYFFIVETIQQDGFYYFDNITFDEIITKFNNGGNMVCHVDGTDYIPLLSVTTNKIIFSGIYNKTSVSLDFDTDGKGTLTTTYLADSSTVDTAKTNAIDTSKAYTEEYVDIRVPTWTDADEGKFLQIVNGTPAWVSIPDAGEASV